MLLSELNPGQRFLLFLGKNWVVFFLLFLCVLFSFTGTGFLSPKTLNNILITSSPALLLAAGETFVIITGGIDLSVGFVMGLCCVISAKIMVTLQALGLSSVTCIAVGAGGTLLLGLLPGLVNGILVAKFRVPPFIATFGMYGIAYGVSEILCNSVPIAGLPALAGFIGNGYLLYYLPGQSFTWFSPPQGIAREEIRSLIPLFPNVFMLSLLAILIFAFILSRTPFGQHTYAIGGNIDAARRAGIPVDRHLIKVYMISSFFASLSGVLATLIFSIGAPTQFASSLELFAVAAVVIGGASLMGGKGSMLGTFLGVLVLSVLEIGFLMSGILPFYRYVAVGVTLIIAVLIDQSFPELVYD